MAINYVVTKKVDTTKGETNVRYYATTRALQKKPVDSAEIARQLAEKSSLQDGDVMSVLVQLSGVIAEHLHQGRTVSIDGLGKDVMCAEPIDEKVKAFGFDVVTVDGNDFVIVPVI